MDAASFMLDGGTVEQNLELTETDEWMDVYESVAVSRNLKSCVRQPVRQQVSEPAPLSRTHRQSAMTASRFQLIEEAEPVPLSRIHRLSLVPALGFQLVTDDPNMYMHSVLDIEQESAIPRQLSQDRQANFAEKWSSSRKVTLHENYHGDDLVFFLQGLSASAFLLMFLGGLGTLKRGNEFYKFFWVVSFTICGAMCFLNLLERSAPVGAVTDSGVTHEILVDFCTFYIHIPMLHGLLFWRKFLRSRSFNRTVKTVIEHQVSVEGAESIYDNPVIHKLKIIINIASVAQVSFIAYAWVCWAVPPLFEDIGWNFSTAHSLVMFFVIPPVIAVVLVNPFLFSLVSLIHFTDANDAVERMMSPRFAPGHDGYMHLVAHADGGFISEEAEIMVKEFASLGLDTRRALAINCICEPLISAQDRLSHTCSLWDVFYIHVFAFACFQVFAVGVSFAQTIPELQTDGHWLSRYFAKYLRPDLFMWYWTMIDMFHLTAAVILLGSLLFGAPMVTGKFQHLAHKCVSALIKRHLPLDHLSDAGVVGFVTRYAEGWTVMNHVISSGFVTTMLTAVGTGMCFLAGQT